jgi:hypothetical protein
MLIINSSMIAGHPMVGSTGNYFSLDGGTMFFRRM